VKELKKQTIKKLVMLTTLIFMVTFILSVQSTYAFISDPEPENTPLITIPLWAVPQDPEHGDPPSHDGDKPECGETMTHIPEDCLPEEDRVQPSEDGDDDKTPNHDSDIPAQKN